jgi:uncharacterized membrane protein
MSSKSLSKDLSEWQDHGLLSPDQVQNILAYEKGKVRGSRMMLALTLLAMLAIGLGLISIIAANWEEISGGLKLAIYFSLATLWIAAITYFESTKTHLYEGLVFGFNLFILAGIGLIAQVFHVPSDGWGGLALWTSLSLLPLLKSKSWPIALLWSIAWTLTWTAWFIEQRTDEHWRMMVVGLSFIGLGLLSSRRGQWMVPRHISPITLTISAGWVLIGNPWLQAGYQHAHNPSIVFRDIALLGFGFGLWLLALRFRQTRLNDRQMKVLGLVFALCLARSILAYSVSGDFFRGWPNLIETVLFSCQLILMGVLALQKDRIRLFDVFTFLIAARILALFLGLFGTLLMTGTGLIAFGICVLLSLRIWYRYHERIRDHIRVIFG